jgi:hypothetical protein
MNMQGQFVDQSTNAPVPNVLVNIFQTGDMSGTPDDSFQSDGNGNFNYTSSVADSPTASLSTQANNYYQLIGNPGYFSGSVQLTPLQATGSSIPWWVWGILILLVVGYYLHSRGKLKF